MDAMTMQGLLEQAIEDNQEDRHYLGMSEIGRCPLELYRKLVNGREPADAQLVRYGNEGRLHEQDVIERLDKMGIRVVNTQKEIVADFDSRFRGHIDGELALGDYDLLEVKSVKLARFERVRVFGVFEEHIYQTQCYMRYGGYLRAFVVYKNRDTGEVAVCLVELDGELGARLEQKAREVLAAVDGRIAPACTCGWCR